MEGLPKLAAETLALNKQAIIFTASRASAEKTSEEIAKLTSLSYPELEQNILRAGSTPTKQCSRLSKVIRKGVAFHHAGLLQKQKDLIEDKFKSGEIKVICATPTLAAGLSLPVYRVIIKSLKRFSGKWGMDWIPVLEYLQMAGRAGRPEYESIGEAICLAKTENEKQEIYDRYICGEPEEIYSKLAVEPVLRTYLLSLISSGIIQDKNGMREFFAKTFWAAQFNDMEKLEGIMERMLIMLTEWKFIQSTQSDFQVASEMITSKTGDDKLRPTLVGKRISELYLDPLTANHLLECLDNFNGDTFSLLQMITHTLEMRPLLRVKTKEEDDIYAQMVNFQLLEKEPSAYDLEYSNFINSIKTALFFQSWIDENKEDFLLDKFGIRPGEIRMKLETANWLLYAAAELAQIKELKEVTIALRKLRMMVKNGVKEELLPLMKLKGVGRIRARKLFHNGLKSIQNIKLADISTLNQLLGPKLAVSVKTQLGQEVKEIPKGTRKGQLSLNKY